MPAGPMNPKLQRQYRAKRTRKAQQKPSKTSKPQTPAQRNAPAASKNGKRPLAVREEDPELKRRRLATITGAPGAPDPDPSPEPGAVDDDDESDGVQPKNPAWAQSAWLLDANCDEDTRIATGTQEMYDGSRVLVRYTSEYPNQTRILTYGVVYRNVPLEDRPGQCQDEYNADVEAEELWLRWCDHFPEIEDHLDYLADNPALVLIIGRFVNAVAAKVRSDDLGRLNQRIIGLSGIEDPKDILQVKSNRGWEDVRTARLLCPLRYLKNLDANPNAFLGHVRNFRVKLFTLDYPSMMYDMSLVDPDDAEAGFLRSPLLVKYYKTIMTGRSSVFNSGGGPTRGQRSLASRYELDYVSIHSIVYIALLARSALTDHEWSDVDGKFWKAEDFLDSIMRLAYSSPDWFTDTMAWWNKEIYGHDDELDSETEREMEGSAFYVIMSQRKAHGKNAVYNNVDDNPDDNGGDNTGSDHDPEDQPVASGSVAPSRFPAVSLSDLDVVF
ncbi:hypothetical protein GSI_01983 [Ganoderma sinense ZZ0214-1]|uniref:Uncharacterized protein n=1 Tax=Ganoderma sinense ZZ0214-1 TaxID=1077348 RepID=A0A2G8SNV7_9APHY|nr:hypothetical protein GSI_01983 [Ganoderma sinense ZZ0214-1]